MDTGLHADGPARSRRQSADRRSQAVIDAMKKHGVVYFAAVGGAGALIAKRVKEYEVLAYGELGPEAVARMKVEDFPVIVVMDSEGKDFYQVGQAPYVEE